MYVVCSSKNYEREINLGLLQNQTIDQERVFHNNKTNIENCRVMKM